MKNILAIIGGITVVAVIVAALIFTAVLVLFRRGAPVVAPTLQRATLGTPTRVSGNGVRLLVTKLFDPCDTDTLYKPAPNERPVGVEVALFNDSNPQSFTTAQAYYTLIGSDGLPYEARYFWCDRGIEDIMLPPGQSQRGVVGFQLPNGVVPKLIRFNRSGVDAFAEAPIP
jgi:hypothetical protein